jgi:hypothetical protein
MDYTQENEFFYMINTVSSIDPWDWFAEKYESIKAIMQADKDLPKLIAARIAKKQAAVTSGVAAAKEAVVADALWITEAGGYKKPTRKPRADERPAEILKLGNPKYREEIIRALLCQDACPKCHGKDINCDCVTKMGVIGMATGSKQ